MEKSADIGIARKLLGELLNDRSGILDSAGISQHGCDCPADIEVSGKLPSCILQQG